MPSTAGVGKQPQQIQGVFGNEVSIQNVGPGDVYLGTDGSVTPSNGWLLPARGMGTWSGGTQLWACTDGATCELRIADSALTYFTPGPDHVTVDGGTVTIDNASIPISGSVDIASGTIDATISGPVTISGGTVTVGGTVASQNSAAVLLDDQTTVFSATTTGVNVYDSFAADLSPYSSLVFTLGNVNLSGVNAGRALNVYVQQYTQTGVLVKVEQPQYLESGYMRYTTQIVAPRIVIMVQGIGGTMSLQGVNVLASTADMDHFYYQYPGNTNYTTNLTVTNLDSKVTTGYTSLDFNIAASVNGYWFPESRGGLMGYAWATNTSISSVVELRSAITGYSILFSDPLVFQSSGIRSETGTFIVPETPLMFSVLNQTAAAGKGNARFTYSS